MNLTQFEREKVFAPFLGSTLKSINGLDQLGLNLTSERIFDFLLPGLNNVTNRIRYYSFYSWFFEWYADTIKIVSPKEQMKYLRRAEFLLALIAAHKQQGGVPGITRALEVHLNSTGIISLDEGTYEERDDTEGSYWKNTRGVLGQYYISSLKQIGIINDQGDKEGVYVRTDFKNPDKVSGAELAKAFKENIGEENLELFISIVKNKQLNKQQLEILGEVFNMLEVPSDTSENKLLLKLLLGPDKPGEISKTFYRRFTIINLLNLLHNPGNDLRNQYHMPLYAYEKKIIGEKEKDNTWSFWWLFMLEQYWSISATAILKAVLHFLNNYSGSTWIDLEKIVELLSEHIVEEIEATEEGEVKIFKDLTSKPHDEREFYEIIMGKGNQTEKLIAAIYFIHKILNTNREYFRDLIQLSKKHRLFTPSSFLKTSESLIELEEIPLIDFIKHFLRKYIFYRHHFVSLKKMNGSQSTAKFIIDEGRIRYIDTFNFDMTSPRIHNVYGFLEDLEVKNKEEFSLTEKGISLLNTIS